LCVDAVGIVGWKKNKDRRGGWDLVSLHDAWGESRGRPLEYDHLSSNQDNSELLDGRHERCEIHTRDVSNMEAISMDVVNASMSTVMTKPNSGCSGSRKDGQTPHVQRYGRQQLEYGTPYVCVPPLPALTPARFWLGSGWTMVTYRVSGYVEKDSASNPSASSAELSRSRNDRDKVRPAQCDIATTCKETMEEFQ